MIKLKCVITGLVCIKISNIGSDLVLSVNAEIVKKTPLLPFSSEQVLIGRIHEYGFKKFFLCSFLSISGQMCKLR